jgi:hypothetical protein
MHRALFRLVPLVAFAFFAATSARAGELKIGDAAPDFSKIVGIDDKEHSSRRASLSRPLDQIAEGL